MKNANKFIYRIVTIAALFLWCSVSVNAHQPVQPGSGGGPSVPLYMRDSSIKDGDTGISVNTEIVLYYSHNIADESIRETNKKEISLKESSGEAVDYEISFPSVFEYRQEVWILPKNLKPDTTYVITVSKNFMSRNGYTTGKKDSITFTTESKEEAEKEDAKTNNSNLSKEEELMKEAKESGIVVETKEKEIKRFSNATAGRVEDTSSNTKDASTSKVKYSYIVPLIFIFVIIILVLKKKHSNRKSS